MTNFARYDCLHCKSPFIVFFFWYKGDKLAGLNCPDCAEANIGSLSKLLHRDLDITCSRCAIELLTPAPDGEDVSLMLRCYACARPTVISAYIVGEVLHDARKPIPHNILSKFSQ